MWVLKEKASEWESQELEAPQQFYHVIPPVCSWYGHISGWVTFLSAKVMNNCLQLPEWKGASCQVLLQISETHGKMDASSFLTHTGVLQAEPSASDPCDRGIGTRQSLRPLPAQIILWFCDLDLLNNRGYESGGFSLYTLQTWEVVTLLLICPWGHGKGASLGHALYEMLCGCWYAWIYKRKTWTSSLRKTWINSVTSTAFSRLCFSPKKRNENTSWLLTNAYFCPSSLLQLQPWLFLAALGAPQQSFLFSRSAASLHCMFCFV